MAGMERRVGVVESSDPEEFERRANAALALLPPAARPLAKLHYGFAFWESEGAGAHALLIDYTVPYEEGQQSDA